MSGAVLRRTRSLCPACHRQLDADLVRRGGAVHMEKRCPEHGAFSAVVWRGEDRLPMDAWRGAMEPIGGENLTCPEGCGLCAQHRQDTCCVLLELTARCNLRCSHCLACAGEQDSPADPSLATVRRWLDELAAVEQSFVQLSGGEPTLRDDLPAIVAHARSVGMRWVQLNTNGLRLADEPGYARELAEAGLSFVFLQFDSLRDEVYETLRGQPLLARKQAAVEHCAAAGLGVTLVCTAVPGLNDGELGELLDWAVARSPAVRGVHFQPVSFFGRRPAPPRDADRLTLPELLHAIETQSGGRFRAGDLAPGRCDHPMCGFHGDFVVLPDGVRALGGGRVSDDEGCCGAPLSEAERSRRFVGRRWERRACCGEAETADPDSLDGFLSRVRSHGFTVTAMAFQDGWNLDLERLRRCSLHVYADGRRVPLCARYLGAPGG